MYPQMQQLTPLAKIPEAFLKIHEQSPQPAPYVLEDSLHQFPWIFLSVLISLCCLIQGELCTEEGSLALAIPAQSCPSSLVQLPLLLYTAHISPSPPV